MWRRWRQSARSLENIIFAPLTSYMHTSSLQDMDCCDVVQCVCFKGAMRVQINLDCGGSKGLLQTLDGLSHTRQSVLTQDAGR